jgi:hypothetical protein
MIIVSQLEPDCAELAFAFLASEIDREANNTPPSDPSLLCPWLYEYAEDDLLILDATGCLDAWL